MLLSSTCCAPSSNCLLKLKEQKHRDCSNGCTCLCAYVHCSHAHHIMDHRAFNRQQLDQVFVSSDFSWLSSPGSPCLHLCQTAFPLDWAQRGKKKGSSLPSTKESTCQRIRCLYVKAILRILLKQNVLPYFPRSVCPYTGVTSHISHIYKGINTMLIIRVPIKPYIF